MCSITPTEGRAAARVLIVGAGPTGLMLALCLKQYGIDFDIVDAKAGPSIDSKALAINPMSQMQCSLFFGDSLLGKKSVQVNNLNINWKNSTRINRIDLSRLKSPFTTMLVQTQFATENELLAHAQEREIHVQWNTRVHDIEQTIQHVLVTTQPASGSSSSKYYDYVIGCDGKRSVVRTAMGATMEQKSYEMFLALADYQLNTELDEQSAHYIIFEETFFVLVPLGNKKWRIVVKHNGIPDKRNGIELIEGPVKKYLGDTLLTGEPFWFSQAPLYVSYAEKLSSDRLFIAGDAAHLFSPIGGTGMNSGFLDALNLGWKLAYKILGYSKENVLTNSYNEERLPAIKENAAATDRLTQLISRIATSDKDIAMFLPTMKNRLLMRSVLPSNVAGTVLNYESSSVIVNTENKDLVLADNKLAEMASVYAQYNRNQAPLIKLFFFLDSKTNETEKILALPRKQGLQPIVVTAHSTGEDILYKSKNHLCIPEKEWNAFTSQYSLVAVRPDGVVACRSQIADYNTMISQSFNYLNAA
ncbi:MAG TPA: FAD-dependent monooxygenase [Cellvibrio sp.]|nr:FAD-dependent monooxygenase [Cellvibrio sp.]